MATRLRQQRKRPIVAFLDIGTNSVRMLIARINPNHTFTTLTQQKEIVRLGEGEFTRERLQPRAMQRAVQVCTRFARMARSYGAGEIVAVATAASREARNRRQFLSRLKREADLDVRVVSGKEEARLIWLGVSSGMNLGGREAVFIDIGGGSTEVIVGDQVGYRYLDTLKLGAIRLATMFRAGETGTVSKGRYKELQDHVRNTAIHTFERVRQYEPDLVIGSSGTVVNLSDIAARKFNSHPSKRGPVLAIEQLEQVIEMLCAMKVQERRKVPGLNPERADIIIPGAAILHTFMQELGLSQLVVSERGLRDGLPLDHLSRSEHADLSRKITFRERSVLQLGQMCGFDEPHARHVARLALGLFDSAGKAGLHDLGNWERDLLEFASLLHDIGTFLSFSDHQDHSAYFIRHADLLGFDDTELEIISHVALFHRRNTPRKSHPTLAGMDPSSQQIVRVLSVMLRLAESLDRSHMDAVRSAELVGVDADTALLRIHATQDCQLEIWGVQNHRKVFRRVFKKDLVIEQAVTRAPAPARRRA